MQLTYDNMKQHGDTITITKSCRTTDILEGIVWPAFSVHSEMIYSIYSFCFRSLTKSARKTAFDIWIILVLLVMCRC